MLGVSALVVVAAAMLLLEHAAEAAVWTVPLDRHARVSAHEAMADTHHRFVDVNSNKRASVWEPAFPHGGQIAVATHEPVPIDFRDIGLLFGAKLFVGTPPQPVTLALDLSTCDVLVNNHKLDTHLFYDHAKSSTYHANGTHVKALEEWLNLDGFVSRDHVSLASTTRMEVRDQPLVEITGPNEILHRLQPKLDGSIGLGLGRADTTGAPSIVRAMIDQHLLDRPVVGLRFDTVTAHAMFGGIDAAYNDSDIHYFAQKPPSAAWTAPLHTIQVGGKRVVENVGNVHFWTFDIIRGPEDQVHALADAAGADDNFVLPCDGLGPDITFQFDNGFQVTLTKNEYVYQDDHGKCRFALAASTSSRQWMLGWPFLHHVYTVLDFGASEGEERIGFAHVKAP